jgi:hypothetical protein
LKSVSLSVPLVILVTIGIVAGPVLLVGFRSECAHWHLAAAANAIELNHSDGQAQLDAARRWYSNLDELQDYWTVRLKQAKLSPQGALTSLQQLPDNLKFDYGLQLGTALVDDGKVDEANKIAEWLVEAGTAEELQSVVFLNLLVKVEWKAWGAARAVEHLRAAAGRSASAKSLALHYSIAFAREHEFEASLEALKLYFGDRAPANSIELNQLAYTRCLAHVELDEALTDINLALEKRTVGWPSSPIADEASLRDTRAWILYRLGRLEDALIDADFAVKAAERFGLLQRILAWLQELFGEFTTMQTAAKPTDTEKSENVSWRTEAEVPQDIWSRGVMRYHRAKILTDLGRGDEARADWDWLAQHRLPPDDHLH